MVSIDRFGIVQLYLVISSIAISLIQSRAVYEINEGIIIEIDGLDIVIKSMQIGRFQKVIACIKTKQVFVSNIVII